VSQVVVCVCGWYVCSVLFLLTGGLELCVGALIIK
jgi:hypothetical protein